MSIAPPPGPGTARQKAGERRIALFGGTFDPIHIGHLAVARAAERRFHLDEIHFIPTGRPPHKRRRGMASYADRYAMVALACADHPRFIPSLAESGADHSGRETYYSVDTIRHFKQKFHGADAHLYFLLGADSFLDIPTWKDYETLLGLCDFIVASRPGFHSNALRLVIPPELFARPGSADAPLDPRAIALRRTTIYLLDTVSSHVSATEVRHRLDANQSIHGLVPPRVEEYITKQALYR
ncbi:MAG TPA: nicotinate-nucleotide adenylyltransferase [Candidatus Dormibacteraeota bacterium]|nr:nicotinate-nucleotide adenylyltransferase [Candidatus Dormibacteraeota bacterium]